MRTNRLIRLFGVLTLASLPLTGGKCNSGELFKEISTELAAPISVSVDTAKKRAYVVNSNNTFEFTTTTFSVLDITDPKAPVLLNNPVNPIPMTNFSGQMYYDPAKSLAYVTNRESEDESDIIDHLFRIHLDESSSDFGKIDDFAGGENPFGIACCDTKGLIYVVNAGGKDPGGMSVYDPTALEKGFVGVSFDLRVSGDLLSGRNASNAVILNDQVFVTNHSDRIFVLNAKEVGDATKNVVDYVLKLRDSDFRGIATDGSLIYVVDGRGKHEKLRIFSPGSIPPTDTDTQPTEGSFSDIQTAEYEVEKDPNEVLVYKGKAFVTNRNKDTLTIVNLSANPVTSKTISVGEEPFGITAFEMNGVDYVYVTNIISDSISIVDFLTEEVVATFKP